VSRIRLHRGFTIIEVMVALAIVAFSLTAIAASMGQMIDAANAMRDRTYASWIAQNKIAELRLANELPDPSETNGEIEYAGTTWAWTARIEAVPGGLENFFQVHVSVSYPGDENAVRTVTGFIGEPVIPGQANRSWNRGSEGVAGARK
jgi:general secretion pathway protein I